MKKIAIFCCAALALGFASCDDKSDMGKAQENPQLPAVVASSVNPTLSAEFAATTVDLNGLTKVGAISNPEIADMPAGAELTFEMQIATEADFSDAQTFPVTDGQIAAADWNNYFREMLGKNNKPLTNYIRFAAYFVQGSQLVRVGSLDTWYGSHSVLVTPASFNYGLLAIDSDKGMFNLINFNGDGNSYQGMAIVDTDFTVTNDGVFMGPFGAKKPGMQYIDFTLDKGTAKVTNITSLGLMGDFNAWKKQANLTQEGMKYVGEIDFADGGEFKIRMNNNNGLTYGGYCYDMLPGGQNMKAPGAGVYNVTVDFNSAPYTITFAKK